VQRVATPGPGQRVFEPILLESERTPLRGARILIDLAPQTTGPGPIRPDIRHKISLQRAIEPATSLKRQTGLASIAQGGRFSVRTTPARAVALQQRQPGI
jgi:hypothetical protein